MIKESDWKKFKKIKAAALNRFCGTILKDISEGLNDRDIPTNHARYLYLYKLIENYDEQIALLFNDHSRSKAIIQLIMLRQDGLVNESDIVGLSDELKEQTNPKNHA